MLRYPSGQVDCSCPFNLLMSLQEKGAIPYRDIKNVALLQERRIRYPVADEEEPWPGDPTRSYAGTPSAHNCPISRLHILWCHLMSVTKAPGSTHNAA